MQPNRLMQSVLLLLSCKVSALELNKVGHRLLDDSRQVQLTLHFDQALHRPGDVPTASQQQAVAITPALACQWSFPAPDVLSCVAKVQAGATYQVSVSPSFSALGQALTKPTSYQFTVPEHKILVMAPHEPWLERGQPLTFNVRTATAELDQQVAELELIDPQGHSQRVKGELVDNQYRRDDTPFMRRYQLTPTTNGVYRLVKPTRAGQTAQELWRDELRMGPRVLAVECLASGNHYEPLQPTSIGYRCASGVYSVELNVAPDQSPDEATKTGDYLAMLVNALQADKSNSTLLVGGPAIWQPQNRGELLNFMIAADRDYQLDLTQLRSHGQPYQDAKRYNLRTDGATTAPWWPDFAQHLVQRVEDPRHAGLYAGANQAQLQWQAIHQAAAWQDWLNRAWQGQSIASQQVYVYRHPADDKVPLLANNPALWQQRPWQGAAARDEVFTYQPLLPAKQAGGLYPVRLTQGADAAVGLLQRAAFDIALIDDAVWILKATSFGGDALAGVQFSAICPSFKAPVMLGQTDSSGYLALTPAQVTALVQQLDLTQYPEAAKQCWLWGQHGEQVSALAIKDLSAAPNQHTAVWLSTTQPMYQAGDDVELLVLQRERRGAALTPLNLQVFAPDHQLIAKLPVPVTATGLAHITLDKQHISLQGSYEAKLLDEHGAYLASQRFTIESRELPGYQVTVQAEEVSHYQQQAHYQLQVQSFTGVPLTGKVRVSQRWRSVSQLEGKSAQAYSRYSFDFERDSQPALQQASSEFELTLDAQGRASWYSAVPTALAGVSPLLALDQYLDVQALDQQQQEHSVRTVFVNQPQLIGIDSREDKLYWQVLDGELKPVKSAITLQWGYSKGYGSEKQLFDSEQTCQLSQAEGACDYPAARPDFDYTLSYSQQGVRQRARVWRSFYTESEDPVSIAHVDKVQLWQPTKVTIHSDQARAAMAWLMTDQVVWRQSLELKQGDNQLTVPLSPAMAPAARLLLSYQQPAELEGRGIEQEKPLPSTALAATQLATVWTEFTSDASAVTLPLQSQLTAAALSADSASRPAQAIEALAAPLKPSTTALTEATPAQPLALTLHTDAKADVALFWLNDAMLYQYDPQFLQALSPNPDMVGIWHELTQVSSRLWPGPLGAWFTDLYGLRRNELMLSGPGYLAKPSATPTPLAFVPQFIGTFSLQAGVAQPLAFKAPTDEGRWHLVQIAASATASAVVTHTVIVKRPLQVISSVPAELTEHDQAMMTLTLLNTTEKTQGGDYHWWLDGQLLAAKTLSVPARQQTQVQVPLPALAVGDHQVRLTLTEQGDKPVTVAEQAIEVRSATVPLTMRVATDTSASVVLPRDATLVHASSVRLGALQPDWQALLHAQQRFSLHQWQLQLADYVVRKQLAERGINANTATAQTVQQLAMPYWVKSGFRNYPVGGADAPLTAYTLVLFDWLGDEKTALQQRLRTLPVPNERGGYGDWAIELQRLRDGDIQGTSPNDRALAALALATMQGLTLDSLKQVRSGIGVGASFDKTSAILVLALQKLPGSDAALAAQWREELLTSTYLDASYSQLANEDACWLMLAVGASEPRLQTLRARVVQSQQQQGDFGSSRANVVCTQALLAAPIVQSTPTTEGTQVAPITQPETRAVKLVPQSTAGLYRHDLPQGYWLSIDYQRPLQAINASGQGLTLRRQLEKRQGDRWQPSTEFHVGDVIRVNYLVQSPIARQQLAITDTLVRGSQLVQIHDNERDFYRFGLGSLASRVEQQGHQVSVQLPFVGAGQTQWHYTTQLKTAGRYQLGVARIENLYDPTVFAHTSGAEWIEVKP